MARVPGTVEMKNVDTPSIDAPLVTTKPIVIPPFGCRQVKGLVESLPVHTFQVHVIAEPITNYQVSWGL